MGEHGVRVLGPGVRAESMNSVAGLARSATRVPAVGETGAVAPRLRRIITPVRDDTGGSVQDRVTEVAPGTACKLATGTGLVVTAREWYPPAEIAVTPVRPAGTVVCPLPLYPQATTVPLARRAREWYPPPRRSRSRR